MTDVLSGWDEAEDLIDARTQQVDDEAAEPEEPTLYYGDGFGLRGGRWLRGGASTLAAACATENLARALACVSV